MKKTSLFIVIVCTIIFAAVPKQISYQGILTDALGQPKIDGAYVMTFKLYDVASEGFNIWSETKTVNVKSGVFTATLGSDSALTLAFDTTYWLGISVAGGAEFTPRVQLTASGYAIRSILADTSSFAHTSQVSVFADSSDKADSANYATNSSLATVASMANNIPATAIAANSIDSTKLGTSSVGSDEIVDGTIVTADVAATFVAPFADSADTARYAKVAGTVMGTSISGKIVTDTVMAVDSTGIALLSIKKFGVYINDSGNVGIGIVAPTTLLDVKGLGNGAGVATLAKETVSFNNAQNVLSLSAQTSNDMVDGFGTQILFHYSDDTYSGHNGALGFIRDGVDQSSAFYVQNYNNGIAQNVLYAKANGYIGMGTSNPQNNLSILNKAYYASLNIDCYSADAAYYPYFRMRKSESDEEGTNVATTDGSNLGGIFAYGNNGSSFQGGSHILFRQDGAVGQFIPSYIGFYTSDGSTVWSERMRVSKDGNIGISNLFPSANIHVGNDTSTVSKQVRVETGGSAIPSFSLIRGGEQTVLIRGDSGDSFIKGGNFGIGLTDPIVPFEVFTNTNSYAMYLGDKTNNHLRMAGTAGASLDYSLIQSMNGGSASNLILQRDGGNVGIGNLIPSQKLHVSGNILATGTITPSDRRLKKNIKTVTNALSKVSKLHGVNYEWQDADTYSSGVQLGLIAQEVKDVIPEVVSKNGDYYGVQYAPLVAVLIEAIKEQQKTIEAQSKEIQEIKKQLIK